MSHGHQRWGVGSAACRLLGNSNIPWETGALWPETSSRELWGEKSQARILKAQFQWPTEEMGLIGLLAKLLTWPPSLPQTKYIYILFHRQDAVASKFWHCSDPLGMEISTNQPRKSYFLSMVRQRKVPVLLHFFFSIQGLPCILQFNPTSSGPLLLILSKILS